MNVNEREYRALGAAWRVSSGGENAVENAGKAGDGEQGGYPGGRCVLRHESDELGRPGGKEASDALAEHSPCSLVSRKP
jgi:hypothetical protein